MDAARQRRALFRYQLIAPLLDPVADREEKTAWRKWVRSREHIQPDGSRARVSARTLRRWTALYRQGGLEALAGEPRRDAGQSRILTPELVERAIRLKEEDPSRSIPQVIRLMEAAGWVTPGSLPRSTLWTHLAKKGLTQRTRPKEGLRRFEAMRPGDLFQGDTTPGPALPDPQDPERKRRTALITFLDDHSRLICHSEFFWAEDLYALELCFQKVLLRRGLPRRVYVDQGSVYQAKVFKLACAELGIRHIGGTPRHPEGRGKLERWHRSMQEEFLRELSHHPVQTLPELNERLWAWIEEGYHVRVHSETGETPIARFGVGPLERTVTPERLAAVFLWREVRRVDKTGVIRFEGNRYQAPPGLETRKVEVRYHPLHLERLFLFWQGKPVGEAQPLDLKNRRLARVHSVPERPRGSSVAYLDLLLERHQERKRRLLSPLRLGVSDSEVTTDD